MQPAYNVGNYVGAISLGKLTATAVKAAKAAGRYGDGDGLFLLVGPTGAKSWIVRVQKAGKRRDIGLGSAAKVTLALARERAATARSQIEIGIDPVMERRKAAGIPTFRQAAALVHAETQKGWRNGKHGKQWLSSLETHCFPKIGDFTVAELDGPAVRDVLADIWLTKAETARRIRQRIIAITDWAVAKGYREAPLPMAAIDKSLPRQKRSDRHHEALPYSDMPDFMRALRARESVGRLALEFLALTAARSGEVREAPWGEMDLEAALWSVPAGRMKGGKDHVVPLSKAALEVLEKAKRWRMKPDDPNELVFPGQKRGKSLSDMTLTKVMRDMKLTAVPHGLRSTFKDWASETTSFANELSEAALAHAISNKSEAAYRRGNLLDKRRVMMSAWADHCDETGGGNVVRMSV